MPSKARIILAFAVTAFLYFSRHVTLPLFLACLAATTLKPLMRWLGWQMQYHTAHHAFPGVPFHHLRELHDAIFTARGCAPPSMTYWGFQAAVFRAFAGGKTESDYPDDRAWIFDRTYG